MTLIINNFWYVKNLAILPVVTAKQQLK
jgi:hypothetical protein